MWKLTIAEGLTGISETKQILCFHHLLLFVTAYYSSSVILLLITSVLNVALRYYMRGGPCWQH